MSASHVDAANPFLTMPSDPNAPKRGLSAYMFFANEQRESVREENPGIAFGKLLRFDSLPSQFTDSAFRASRQGSR